MKRIWILTNGSSEKKFHNKILLEEFQKRGFYTEVVKFPALGAHEGQLFYYKDRIVDRPDLVFINNSLQFPEDHTRLKNQEEVISILESFDNTIFVNKLANHIYSSHKHNTYKALISAGIKAPKTKIIENWEATKENIDEMVSDVTFPIVVKETYGFNGYNTTLKINSEDLLEHLRDLQTKYQPQNKPIILQEYETESDGLMIKARLIGDDIKAVYKLYSPFSNQKLSAMKAHGHLCISMKVDNKLKDFVYKSSNILGIEVAWFDIFVSNGEYKFCEVNVPGGLYNTIFTNVNPSIEIANFCVSKLNGNSYES